MSISLKVGLSVLAVSVFAMPATALTIVENRCVSVLQADGGCVFSANNDNDIAGIETLYNATTKAGRNIHLRLITKSDDDDFGDFGSITGDGGQSGTWHLPGHIVDYISVKAGTEFKLVKLTTPGTTGDWSTLNILNRGGQRPDLSHVSFFGGVIPEPATWAMMIAGFGLVGGAMRRRRTSMAHEAA